MNYRLEITNEKDRVTPQPMVLVLRDTTTEHADAVAHAIREAGNGNIWVAMWEVR